MHCDYYDAGQCRSCTWLPTPYAEQLAAKQCRVEAALASTFEPSRWSPPAASAESGFRTKAKMVVTGTVAFPRLGILGEDLTGQDLRRCGLHAPAIYTALPVLADFVSRASLTPYDVAARVGELKHLIVTAAPDGALMVRLVLRSTEALSRIRKHLSALTDALPGLKVVSVNLQPLPAALLQGPQEVLLWGDRLRVRINDVELELAPQSFFQTNTAVAAALYAQARDWVGRLTPASVWDLYCGVGGFALHVGAQGRRVTGVELDAAAVEAARRSAGRAGVAADFEAADATTWLLAQQTPADVVLVNPPRRGLSEEVCAWLEGSSVGALLYSSCRVDTLARDLDRLPGFVPAQGRLFDMFPHTSHSEVLVLALRRRDASTPR